VIYLNMKKFITKWFSKWAQKNQISNEMLIDAIENLESGLSSFGLGGNLYKVRVSRKGKGKSGGFRTIVVYKEHHRVIFIYGFAKNDKQNLEKNELVSLKKLGNDLISLHEQQLKEAIKLNVLFKLED